MIEIDNVTKFYADRRVVDGLTLTVPAGELCVL
ncbi:MAG: ABC transporter ATP-binding protein, partial [Alphaproteobacteria bacterium]|nr:ABC transporter ATP-binding protein [Alphaproteobacteria bacterium]